MEEEKRTRRRQTAVQLSATLVDEIRDLAKANGVTITEVAYTWVASAAWLAAHGFGDLLPQERHAPRGTHGPHWKWIKFQQGEREYHQHRDAIEAAGSTIPAVLRVAGESYVRAGGNLLTMDWPAIQGLSIVA